MMDDNNALLAFHKGCLFYATVLNIDTNYKIWKKVELSKKIYIYLHKKGGSHARLAKGDVRFFAFAYKGGSLDGLGEPLLKHRARLSWKTPKCFGTIRLSSSEDRSKIPLAWSYLEPEVRWPVYFQINTNIPFALQYFMINIRCHF